MSPQTIKILGLGCGSGLDFELLNQQLSSDFEYTGFDISSEMIAQANAKHSNKKNAQFLVMNMENISYFPSNEFDVAISFFGSFSHAINHTKAVSEIERVLKPGGKIFLMVYSRFSLKNFWKALTTFSINPLQEVRPYEIRKTTGSIFCDARFYTKESIEKTFTNFEQLKVQGLNALLELPLLRSPFLPAEQTQKSQKFLLTESRILSHFPNFCHSLIITGVLAK
jgi:ubiquinone/menaquinone biosynthesis C-methylase UbiE